MTLSWARKSLTLWVTLQVLVLALVLGLVALAIGGGKLARTWEWNRQRESLRSLMDVVEPSASAACFADDAVLAEQVVRGLIGTSNVQAARIRSGDRVLAEASRPMAAGPSRDYPEISRPLASPFIKDSILGELTLVPDARESERRGNHIAALFLAWLLGALGGSAAITALTVHWVISRPIADISREFKGLDVATGMRIAVPWGHGNDEIGGLVGSLNSLIQRLMDAVWKEQEASARPGLAPPAAPPGDAWEDAGILVVRGNGSLEAWTPESLKVLGLAGAPPLPGVPFRTLFGAEASQAEDCLEQVRSGGERSAATLRCRVAGAQGLRWLRIVVDCIGPDWFQVTVEDVSPVGQGGAFFFEGSAQVNNCSHAKADSLRVSS